MYPEIQTYLERLDDLRNQIRDLVADLPAEALNWRPIEDSAEHATNSMGVLATHAAGAEHFWIGEVIGGMPATRDRDAEFRTKIEHPEKLLQLLDTVDKETRTVMAWLTAGNLDETRLARGKLIPVRWIILHVIDHTALHLGHMQLTYQLWKGGETVNNPRWFERLPQTS